MIPAVGDRIRMIGTMPNDPDPIPVGSEGTVEDIGADTAWGHGRQIFVTWDNGRTLILLSTDPFEVIA